MYHDFQYIEINALSVLKIWQYKNPVFAEIYLSRMNLSSAIQKYFLTII